MWSLKNPAYVGNAYGHCTRLVPAKSRRSPLAPVGAGSHRQMAPKKGSGSPSRSPRSSNGRPSIWSNIHPRQEERHEVLSGTLWGRVGGQEQVFTKGQRVIGPAGVPHAWRNPSEDEERHIVSELRPPLRFETLFETAFGLARDGKTTKQGMPKNPLQLAVLVDESEGTYFIHRPPVSMQRAFLALFAVLASVGKAARVQG